MFYRVFKFNPNHDELGRFSSAGFAPGFGPAAKFSVKANKPTMTPSELVEKAFSGQPEVLNEFYAVETKMAAAIDAGLETYKAHITNAEALAKNPKARMSFTADRRATHRKIVEDYLANSSQYIPKEGEQPHATILGGRGGSGKGHFKESVYDPKTTLVLDPDKVKKAMKDYDPEMAYLSHKESVVIFDKLMTAARAKGINVVVDITMSHNPSGMISVFRKHGYGVSAHFMHVSPQEAAFRALRRWAEGIRDENGIQTRRGRLVPPEVVYAMTDNEKNFDAILHKVDDWSLWANDRPIGVGPRKVTASKGEGFSHVLVLKYNPYHDAKGRFTSRGNAGFVSLWGKKYAELNTPVSGMNKNTKAVDIQQKHIAEYAYILGKHIRAGGSASDAQGKAILAQASLHAEGVKTYHGALRKTTLAFAGGFDPAFDSQIRGVADHIISAAFAKSGLSASQKKKLNIPMTEEEKALQAASAAYDKAYYSKKVVVDMLMKLPHQVAFVNATAPADGEKPSSEHIKAKKAMEKSLAAVKKHGGDEALLKEAVTTGAAIAAKKIEEAKKEIYQQAALVEQHKVNNFPDSVEAANKALGELLLKHKDIIPHYGLGLEENGKKLYEEQKSAALAAVYAAQKAKSALEYNPADGSPSAAVIAANLAFNAAVIEASKYPAELGSAAVTKAIQDYAAEKKAKELANLGLAQADSATPPKGSSKLPAPVKADLVNLGVALIKETTNVDGDGFKIQNLKTNIDAFEKQYNLSKEQKARIDEEAKAVYAANKQGAVDTLAAAFAAYQPFKANSGNGKNWHEVAAKLGVPYSQIAETYNKYQDAYASAGSYGHDVASAGTKKGKQVLDAQKAAGASAKAAESAKEKVSTTPADKGAKAAAAEAKAIADAAAVKAAAAAAAVASASSTHSPGSVGEAKAVMEAAGLNYYTLKAKVPGSANLSHSALPKEVTDAYDQYLKAKQDYGAKAGVSSFSDISSSLKKQAEKAIFDEAAAKKAVKDAADKVHYDKLEALQTKVLHGEKGALNALDLKKAKAQVDAAVAEAIKSGMSQGDIDAHLKFVSNKIEAAAKKAKAEASETISQAAYKLAMANLVHADNTDHPDVSKAYSDFYAVYSLHKGTTLTATEANGLRSTAAFLAQKNFKAEKEFQKTIASLGLKAKTTVKSYDADDASFKFPLGDHEFANHAEKQIAKLTPSQKNVITDYTGDDFSGVNRAVGLAGTFKMTKGLSGQDVTLNSYVKESMTHMDAAFSKTTLGKNVRLRRGMPQKYFLEQLGITKVSKGMSFSEDQLKSMVGKVYKETAFSSTTMDKDKHISLASESSKTGSMSLFIRAGKDMPGLRAKAISNHGHEEEVILPRGTTYVIRRAFVDPGTDRLHVEVDMLGAFPDPL